MAFGQLFSSCQRATREQLTPALDFDTLKFKQANANPDDFTMLRIMIGDKLKAGGYFHGLPGIMPDGEVDTDKVRKDSTVMDDGTAIVYYRYMDSTLVREDTFKIFFGK